jgi:uncharacterized protein YjiS (DUF1127 family)
MGEWIRAWRAALGAVWRPGARELHALEERTLKDLGIDRSEIPSVEWESRHGEPTRLRIAPSQA